MQPPRWDSGVWGSGPKFKPWCCPGSRGTWKQALSWVPVQHPLPTQHHRVQELVGRTSPERRGSALVMGTAAGDGNSVSPQTGFLAPA